MSCGIFVQFFKYEICRLGKFVSFIAEVESVEAEGVIRLTGGRPPYRKPSWITGVREDDDGFGYLRN
jgi:hypothetical protein